MLRLALLPLGGYENDLSIFAAWSHLLAAAGTHGLYGRSPAPGVPQINYPPGYALVLLAVTDLVRVLPADAGPHADHFLKMALKLPAVLCDLVQSAAIYRVVASYRAPRDSTVAAAIVLFAPWTWPVSAIWGQVDAICTAGMLVAVALALAGRFTLGWLALAAAILVKPFPLLLVPLYVIVQIRRQGLAPRIAYGPLAAVALAYVVSLPFAPSAAPGAVAVWLAGVYASGQTLFPATSIDAYNIWTVAASPVSDLLRAGGLTLEQWGGLAVILFEASIAWALAKRLAPRTANAIPGRDLCYAAFAVLASLFVLATRMHERYLIYALAFAAPLWLEGGAPRLAACVFGTTFTLNVTLDLAYKHAHVPEIAAITHVLSIVNVTTLALLSWPFLVKASSA